MELKRNKACAPVRNSSLYHTHQKLANKLDPYTPSSPPFFFQKSESNLQTQCNIPIAILIIFFKHIRHPLEANTRLNKQIKAHSVLPAAIISAIQQRDKLL